METNRYHTTYTDKLRTAALIILLGAAGFCFPSLKALTVEPDSITSRFPVRPTVPRNYDDLLSTEFVADLSTPSNITTAVTPDPATGNYLIRILMGGTTISGPFSLTPQQYSNWQSRIAMQRYWKEINRLDKEGEIREPFDILDMNFSTGPLERIFGPGGIKLQTRGEVRLKTGITTTKTDNPALALSARRKTFFDFDQKINASVGASVGERLKFDMTYNTDATFDFDSKNIRLGYEGGEDDIVKSIEAGNVSMTTGSSLIRGSAALFGIKTKLQFGKLTATALVSQQNSESKSIRTDGGVQTTDFTIEADNYDQNRHYFLSQYFFENYDNFASRLPFVASGINITRIEVWITNKTNNYNNSRNIVAFTDLGESSALASPYWTADPSVRNPSNKSNNLLSIIKTDYPDARNINLVTQVLEPLSAHGITGGRDFEKVESARLLDEKDFILNPTLGYISVNTALSADEVLGVAFEYTLNGEVFQVGEFSTDITDTSNSLYVKMLKSTTVDTRLPMWRLMMKNVYSLGAYQVERSNFRLDIKYLSDTTGTMINYLPVPSVSDRPLLQLMNLDRLDSNNQSNPDGFFDFVEGYTILPQSGKIIFPVAEPFGNNLRGKIGNPADAEKYTYPELYDSTLVIARQFSDKNKFVICGSYRASSGSQIRLDAMNIPRGSVIVTAGGVRLTENSDYTVDYNMGIVTITNQSIIDSGQSINVTLENQSLFSTQRKTLLGLDLQYAINRNFNLGATIMHFSEKALTEKVNIGEETVNNSMIGFNLSYITRFHWLTNWLNMIPTVNATEPSSLSVTAEYARLMPHSQDSGSAKGSSYIDDFESTQTGIDLRSPYSWFLSSTPFDNSPGAMFPEASLSGNTEYGKNRALLNWYYIDRMFTQRNSSLCPGYIKSDLKQLSNPYIREVTSREIFPGRELTYGESSIVQTLNLSFYPTERGPYNVDAVNIDSEGNLLYPEKRWGGIMRKMENPNFEQSNIEYIQFWLLNPFLDPENDNREGGDLYFNLGEISEDILKDGMKSYENGIPYDGDDRYLTETVWGRVSKQNSLTYSFDNNTGSRLRQDVGLDGLPNEDEYNFTTYRDYLDKLRLKLSNETLEKMENNLFSPLNDPAGDNYHFFRGYDYDEQRLGILERYKRYNGVEGNSLSPEDAPEPLYQSARSVPDVEDINQDNTLNEYERYFQYKVSIRPEDLVVGKNFITDKQMSMVTTRSGDPLEVEWYQFKIPLTEYEKTVGSISDFSTIRFARIFMTGFKAVTHLRFATLELVRGEWRTYDFNLNNRGDTPADGSIDISTVNIEENADREPVNYILPPGVSRIVDPGQAQITQLNEQSMSMKVVDLQGGDARGVYRNTLLDLRNYRKLQMFVHAESLIDNSTNLRDGELSLFVRLGSDLKYNYYEYEIPLSLTPPGHYNGDLNSERLIVWPEANFLDLTLQTLVDLKKERNREKNKDDSGVGYGTLYTGRDPENEKNRIAVIGNPSLADVRVMFVGVRNTSPTKKSGTVWVNELRVTDFDESGGWAAKGNVNLAMSDIATLNFGAHIETSGFGGVDESLNNRRNDDYRLYNFAMQVDAGRFFPEKANLRAPIFYSYSSETTTPKYNPLDRDVLLKDAIDDAPDKHARDSIRGFAVEHSKIQTFSLSGLKFDVRDDNPKPWDPANFTVNFSFNKQSRENPTTEYEKINDYRGNFQYSYSPYIKPLRPFSFIKSKNRNLKFIHDWEVNWAPASISFLTTMSRYYYEQQTRSEVDRNFNLPVSVSKNFLWDRQFSLTWNLTRSLSVTFNSNTSARIDETPGAVNKKLFPDEYKQWKDTVIHSLLSLGTPWGYNQSFTASYRAPFNRIPALDFISANLTYNSTYRWDRGATIDGVKLGNTIANMGIWNLDSRLNLESVYSKIPYLQDVDKRFSSRSKNETRKPRRFNRSYNLKEDTSTIVTHNLHGKKTVIRATTPDGKPFPLKTRRINDNEYEILNRGNENIRVTVVEVLSTEKGFWSEAAKYATRLLISPRSVAFKWRKSRGLTVPLFRNDIGNIFGQSTGYGPMSPGIGFAFGDAGTRFIDRAKERGWLITDDSQTSPAISAATDELHLELNIEPVRGLKIQLTMNRTDNRNNQIHFMYDNIPVSRAGSYTKTHCAIATSLRSSNFKNGYASNTFNRFLENIPIVSSRIEKLYDGVAYPSTGFMDGNSNAGKPYDPSVGKPSATGGDVLIPAFLAAYSGRSAEKIYLDPFPSFSHAMPNWRVTYDGFIALFDLKDLFKTFTLSHAYQCTYSVGSYSSYLNWIEAGGKNTGFTLDELTGEPIPSSPFNITSVAITERFAPLIGARGTLRNDLSLNLEFRDSRTVTLNTGAGQIVEASQRGLTLGAGYKIVGFNTFLKLAGKHSGVSNDLTVNADLTFQTNQALIRRIESNYTQATSGSRSLKLNFSANYVVSRRLTIGCFLDHQVNTPLVTTTAFPTTNSSYGITLNLSLAR